MKNRKYLLTGVFVLAILSIIFIIKGIFPFGDNSIIWSDMHEQITAIYYHFYDAIRGNSSIFVDFSSSGGVNFVGIMAYYILSPFTLILLLFPRELVENAVSIVVALKILASSLTCLYFISSYFKNIKTPYQILLSLLYAFSSYTLALYIITPWMDLVYLLPLLLMGLRKLLDLEDTKMYIIVLSVSLICSFYVTFMVLLFIIFSSLIYLYIYKKDNIRKAIFDLGASTLIALLISSVILVPTFLQIFSSQRVGFDFDVIINSKFGPLSDKISFVFGSATLLAFTLMLLFNYKKHKRFSLFIVLNLILLGLPLIVEPINKMLHFGSYVYFPYRYGFLLIFLLVIAAAYYLNNIDVKGFSSFKLKRIVPILAVLLSFLVMFFVFYKFKLNIKEAIDHLTLTRDKKALLSLFLVFVSVFISSLIIIYFNRKNDNITIFMLYILCIGNILFNCYFYIGGYDPDGRLALQYDQMLEMNKIRGVTDNYYIKEVNRDLISNYGMVANINTYSNFTSLTDKTNFLTMQRLGYDSYWMDTESIGGNLFTDIILAQKYIVSKDEIVDSYYKFINTDTGLNYYEFINNMPYGFIVNKNASLVDSKNSFDASNIIYNSITGNGNIFDIYDLFSSDEPVSYSKDLVLNKKINVVGRERLYLDILSSFDNVDKVNNYKAFNVYVNDKLIFEEVPNDSRNGSLLLGEFNDEEVDVKVVSLKNANIRNITLGVLNLKKIDSFLNNSSLLNTINVSFNRNTISVNAQGNEGDILFLPVTYLDGYISNTHEILRVYDNFFGIKLKDGTNNIEIVYIPRGLIIGALLSFIGLVLFFVWTKYLYNVNFDVIYNVVYYIYLFIYVLLIMLFYVLMLLAFIKSFLF